MSDDNFQSNLVRVLDPDPDPIGVTSRLFLYVVWVCILLRGKARNSGKKKKRKKKKISKPRNTHQGWPEEAQSLNRTRRQLSFPNVMLLLEIMTG